MWDGGRWLEDFAAASASRDTHALHALRCKVYEGTVAAVRGRGYDVGGEPVELDVDGSFEALRTQSIFYEETEALLVESSARRQHRTIVSVHNADFLEIARALATPDSRPAVLNMASRRNPGGLVLEGSGAQEENLFRRSNALYSLYQFVAYAGDYGVPRDPTVSYPIPRKSGGIFSPGVTVFRSAETTGYAFLRHPHQVDVLTVPAINRPDVVERDGLPWLSDDMAAATMVKVRAILRIATRHAKRDLVLSAFGCGAYRNPPHHVADLFRLVLRESEFEGVFRRVAFAVIDDHNAFRPGSPEGNYVPFERALGGWCDQTRASAS